MYRAKAEIVNGLRVFADGKWLTCIGNKNVQAGDLIWTDGQCVYGFNKISQQPLSITTSQDADWCIPIVIDNVAYIFKSNLREIGKFGSYHISNNRADKIYKCYTGSRKDSNVLGSGTIAFNVSGNNIYALHLADSENSGKGWKHLCTFRFIFKKGDYIDENNNSIKRSSTSPAGNLIEIAIVKDKAVKPDRLNGYYTLKYDIGVDILNDTVELACWYDIIRKRGSYFDIIDTTTGELLTEKVSTENGDEIQELKFQGKSSLLEFLRTRSDIFNLIYKQVNEKLGE